MTGRRVTPREQDTIKRAKKFLPGGSTGNMFAEVIIDRGQGSHVWDISGNEYVDYLLGSGPMVIGHAHPEVTSAVMTQVPKGSTFFAMSEPSIQLAEEIAKAVPCAQKVRYTSTGTEATLYAMRAARAYRKKDKVLKFEGGFHGMNDYSLMSLAPANPKDYPHPVPDTPGIPKSIQNEVLIAPFNNIETTSAIIDKHHNELGGVIVEPFQRLLPPKPGFLQGLREITQRYGIPLIFDEIVTGFRFSYGGAQEYYGVTPDMCTLGKVVAGGYPLAAVAGRDEIMKHFDPSSVAKGEQMVQIGTLNGNPIACAAGLATLKVLKKPGTYEKLFANGKRIREGLQSALNEAEIPAKVVGEDPLFDVFFTTEDVYDYRSGLKADKPKLLRWNKMLMDRGIFRGDTKFYVSAVHTDADIKQTVDAFRSTLSELQ
ncbi:MAG: aminotransferase class III-fold pyridoxal phosphate-dependent enzyme [SAR202 cluster bacterium]|nr:aminotransferase class III-fold pyridoxal phosphate-dependent enzyme [SAR202 cluster bacterium]